MKIKVFQAIKIPSPNFLPSKRKKKDNATTPNLIKYPQKHVAILFQNELKLQTLKTKMGKYREKTGKNH